MSSELLYFSDNKYRRWYLSIVDKARLRTPPSGYVEWHHVVPKCFGGFAKNSNLVALTFREHFLVHWLLTKCTEGDRKAKMIYALTRMSKTHNVPDRKIANWQIARAAKAHREIIFTKEHREKIGATRRGKKASDETRKRLSDSHKGYEPTIEQREKLSVALKGKKKPPRTREHTENILKSTNSKPPSENVLAYRERLKINPIGLGYKWTEDQKKKRLDAMKGKPLSEKQKESLRRLHSLPKTEKQLETSRRNKPSFRGISLSHEHRKKISDSKKGIILDQMVCAVCGGNFSPGMAARWHGTKCKKRFVSDYVAMSLGFSL